MDSETVLPIEQRKKLFLQLAVAGLLFIVVWAVVFADILASAVNVWLSSDTFNHCFLVLPISLYFIWQQRGAILAQTPSLSMLGGLGVSVCIFLILFGRAAHIDVIEHAGVFAILPLAAWALFGWRVVSQIKFPLLFILFSIPIGEEIVPSLQNLTADIALWFLDLINIPVFRDGLYMTIPNGSFVVAEACSGISFFIACVMLGSAFAYMNFVSQWRAIAFVLFAIALPILANGMRVFGIILIAYKTNMEYAAGADHLIYGSVFFAFIIILLLIAGYFMSDGHRVWQNNIQSIHGKWHGYLNGYRSGIAISALLFSALLLALIGSQAANETFVLNDDSSAKVEIITEQVAIWAPSFASADAYFISTDSVTGAAIYKAVYQTNQADKELIYWSNRLYDIDTWSIKGQYKQTVKGVGEIIILNLVSTRHPPRLLAYWYSVPDINTSNKYIAKLQQGFNALTLQPSGGAVTAISLSYRGPVDDGLQTMKQLLEQSDPVWQNQLYFSDIE